MSITVENIMDASFGEVSSEIRVAYRKTVNIRQYETEVVELETSLKVPNELTGAERMFISALLQIQLEYTAYCQLAFKGLVTATELAQRKTQLEEGIQALKTKAEGVTGKSMDKYIGTGVN